MTAEKFLNRLPKCVIRQGEVIDIRGPIRDTLQVRPALIIHQPLQGTFLSSALVQPTVSCQEARRPSELNHVSVELVRTLYPVTHRTTWLVATPEGVRPRSPVFLRSVA